MDLKARWSDLGGGDSTRAWQAIWDLALAGQSAAPYLGERLRPVPAADAGNIAQWINDLDADDFATRRAASRELERLGELAVPALRKALEGTPSPELRRQATRLVENLAGLSGERLRQIRAIEALEYMGTPEARQIIEKLAEGAPEARLTHEAKAALQRLARR
jgi:HEAT repeat protein